MLQIYITAVSSRHVVSWIFAQNCESCCGIGDWRCLFEWQTVNISQMLIICMESYLWFKNRNLIVSWSSYCLISYEIIHLFIYIPGFNSSLFNDILLRLLQESDFGSIMSCCLFDFKPIRVYYSELHIEWYPINVLRIFVCLHLSKQSMVIDT